MTDSDQQGSERVDVDRQTEQGPALTGGQRPAERQAAVALAVAILAGIGLFVVYFAGGQTQLEGVLFFIAFGGLGIALGIWANHLLDAREVVEERHELTSGAAGPPRFQVAPPLGARPGGGGGGPRPARGRARPPAFGVAPHGGGRPGAGPPLVARQAAR